MDFFTLKHSKIMVNNLYTDDSGTTMQVYFTKDERLLLKLSDGFEYHHYIELSETDLMAFIAELEQRQTEFNHSV